MQKQKCSCCDDEIEDRTICVTDEPLCFECNYWLSLIQNMNANPHIFFICDDHVFQVGNENDIQKGFAGKKFKITQDKNSLKVVSFTTNLWHRGEVPERFRSKCQNNCQIEETI